MSAPPEEGDAAGTERKESKVPPASGGTEQKESRVTVGITERRESKVQPLGTDRRESRFSMKDVRSLSRLRIRRKSYGFASVPGITGGQSGTRASQIALEFRRPILTYLPTYQLDPFRPFKIAEVQQTVEAMVDEFCPTGYKYNPNETPKLVMTMALDIMRAVKAMNFDRYKIITVVTIGQKRSQSYSNTIGFIWDGQRDKYVDVQRLYTTSIIQVTVFGVYFD